MREEFQKDLDELGLGETDRALCEADLNRGDYDAVIERIVLAQPSEIPGVTKGILAKFRAIFSEIMRLEGEEGVPGTPGRDEVRSRSRASDTTCGDRPDGTGVSFQLSENIEGFCERSRTTSRVQPRWTGPGPAWTVSCEVAIDVIASVADREDSGTSRGTARRRHTDAIPRS